MTTQKLEEKILYDAKGSIYSKIMGAVYEPLSLLNKAPAYSAVPLFANTNTDPYKLSNGIYTRR